VRTELDYMKDPTGEISDKVKKENQFYEIKKVKY